MKNALAVLCMAILWVGCQAVNEGVVMKAEEDQPHVFNGDTVDIVIQEIRQCFYSGGYRSRSNFNYEVDIASRLHKGYVVTIDHRSTIISPESKNILVYTITSPGAEEECPY